jgi:hypothetical protein
VKNKRIVHVKLGSVYQLKESKMRSKGRKSPSSASKTRWDLFVSHASEDKAEFVEPLAVALAEFGLKVWYDRFTLSLGDSLSRSIDEGLALSRFGLVVLSPAFLDKGWPEYELRGLTAREIAGRTVILPIWHKITKDDLLRFSPPLADKLAVDSTGLTPIQIAVKIIEQVRPELFQRITRRYALLKALQNAKVEFVNPKIIRSAPVRHTTLPPELIGRIRLVRASLLQAWPCSMRDWLDGFKRDSHPSQEVVVWERIAAVYLEYCALNPELSPEQHMQLWAIILMIDSRANLDTLRAASTNIPARVVEDIFRSYRSELPLNDFANDNDHRGPEGLGIQDDTPLSRDMEHFPNDVPDHLIREIIATENKVIRLKSGPPNGSSNQ